MILLYASNLSHGGGNSGQTKTETDWLDHLTGDAAIGEVQNQVSRGASINHLI